MSGYLANLSPIPAFPAYTGPYKVGTVDIEIPVSELSSPSPAPDNAADIETIQFRVFYPAVDESQQGRISWLPAPQRHHVSAYTRFLGFGSAVANLLSYVATLTGNLAKLTDIELIDSFLAICITRRSLSTRTPICARQTPRTSDGRP